MKNILVLGALVLSLVLTGQASAIGGRQVQSQKIVTRNVQPVRAQKQQVLLLQAQPTYYVPAQQIRVQQLNQGHCPQNIQGLRSY